MLSIIKYLSNGSLLKVSNDNDVSESGCSSGPSAPSASDSELGVADLAVLEPLTEEAVLDNLYTRFKRDMIYVSSSTSRDLESCYQPLETLSDDINLQTSVSTLLVSINPYKKLSLYTPDVIDKYRNHCLHQIPPHM